MSLARCLERLVGIPVRRLGHPATALATLGFLGATAAFLVSIGETLVTHGADFRPRVVGARALLADLSPYSLEVGPETPDELVDVTGEFHRCTRVNVTPSFLLLLGPTSSLPYRTQRIAWAFASWAAIAITALVLARICRRARARLAFLVLVSLLVMTSDFWRLHVERGQYYVFVAALLAIGFMGAVRGPDRIVAGIPFGLAALLRPTCVLALPALWLSGRRRTVAGAVLAAAAGFSAGLPWTGLTHWHGYFWQVKCWEQYHLGNADLIRQLEPRVPGPRRVLDGYDYSNPDLWMTPARVRDTSIQGWLGEALGLSGLGSPENRAPRTARILAGVLAGASIAFALAGRSSGLPLRILVCAGALALALLDYLLPFRYPYADVFFLAPLALLFPDLVKPGAPRVFLFLIAAGLSVGALSPRWLDLDTTTVLRSSAVSAGLVATFLWSVWQSERRSRTPTARTA